MDEHSKSKLLYENANTLRIHQDNLRWTISGGYITVVGSVVYLLWAKEQRIPKEYEWVVLTTLFVLGHSFLMILSVESWYYNAYSRYLEYCEREKDVFDSFHDFIRSDKHRKEREAITPFHYSFVFVLILFAVSNALWLILVLKSLPRFPSCCFGFGYLLAAWASCRHWNSFTFSFFLDGILKRIFSPKTENH